VNFLALLYEAIDLSEDAVLIVEFGQGSVQGFVSGATSLAPIYKTLLRRPISLISTLWPILLSPIKLWRVLELLTHTFRRSHKEPESTARKLPAFELISIAVSPSARGTGVALRLYEGLKEAAKERGFDAFKIIVGEQLGGSQRFYTRMGAVLVGKTSVHGNAVSIIYVQVL
jgi:GNAT superfamily N-acetyltransferase